MKLYCIVFSCESLSCPIIDSASNIDFLFFRLWALCFHQPHGNIHNVWALRLSHQEGGKVSCFAFIRLREEFHVRHNQSFWGIEVLKKLIYNYLIVIKLLPPEVWKQIIQSCVDGSFFVGWIILLRRKESVVKLQLKQGFFCECSCLSLRWVIYNDHKVCLSERPPKDLGYIYFYHRLSSS